MDLEITFGTLFWLVMLLLPAVIWLTPESREVDLKPKSKKSKPFNPFFMDEE